MDFLEESKKTAAPPTKIILGMTTAIECPQEIEAYLKSMELDDKPWFLCSSVVYLFVKHTVSSIPKSQELFELQINGILALTKFINEKTQGKIALFDAESTQDLISKLDGVLADKCVSIDDGLDTLRTKLATTLRKLIVALIEQKELMNQYISEKTSFANTHVGYLKSRFEQAVDVLNSLLGQVKEKYPEAYEKIVSAATLSLEQAKAGLEHAKAGSSEFARISRETTEGAVNKGASLIKNSMDAAQDTVTATQKNIDSQLYALAFNMLQLAQPYVHNAVNRSTPYIASAVEVSQPYVLQAKPYLIDPLVAKAQDVNAALQEHAYFGPIVTDVMDRAQYALEEAKTYCIAGTELEAVVASALKPASVCTPEESATTTTAAAAAAAVVNVSTESAAATEVTPAEVVVEIMKEESVVPVPEETTSPAVVDLVVATSEEASSEPIVAPTQSNNKKGGKKNNNIK